jgi:thiol-disulfide isomerase/thioredoxin
MPPKKIELTTTIRDVEHFQTIFNDRNPKLVVIDVHPTWSGPCEALMPFYKNLQTNVIDEFEKRIDIILVDQEKIESLNIP